MVSCLAFWVAISYHLAACFTRIGSTCGIEIYWRSFQHFGKKRAKITKNATKISKNCAKIVVHFRIYSRKNFDGGEKGLVAPLLQFIWECDSERIVRIGLHLAKLL